MLFRSVLRFGMVLAVLMMTTALARADALFGVPHLVKAMYLLEGDQCLAGCETEEWRITRIPISPHAQGSVGADGALFRFEGKSMYCGSRGCVNAIVLRDETHLVVLYSAYGTRTSMEQIPSAEARALLPRIGRAGVYQRELQEVSELYIATLGEWGFEVVGGEVAMLLAHAATPAAAHVINPALSVITTTLALAELNQKVRKASTAYLWQVLQIEKDHGWPMLSRLVGGDPHAQRALRAVHQDLDEIFTRVLEYQEQYPTRFKLLSMIHRGPLAEIPDVAEPLSAIDRVLRRHGSSLDEMNLLPAVARRLDACEGAHDNHGSAVSVQPGCEADITAHRGNPFTAEAFQAIPRWPRAVEVHGMSQCHTYRLRYIFADAVLTMEGLSTTGAFTSLSLHAPIPIAQANRLAGVLAWGELPPLKTHGTAEVVYEEVGDHGGGQRVVLQLDGGQRVTGITARLWTP